MSSRSACLFAFSLFGASLLGGCVDNDISLAITGFIAPDSSEAMAGICELDASSLTLTRGTYDVLLGNTFNQGYNINFSVFNELEEVANAPIETQAYYINSFDVELVVQGPAQAAIPAADRFFNYPVGSQRIAPQTAGFFTLQAIQTKYLPDLLKISAAANKPVDGGSNVPASQVIVRVRPVATRAEEQQTGAFSEFPIDFCYGCLNGSNGNTLPTCPPQVTTPLAGNVCNIAADAPVTCCQCDANSPIICGTNTADVMCSGT